MMRRRTLSLAKPPPGSTTPVESVPPPTVSGIAPGRVIHRHPHAAGLDERTATQRRAQRHRQRRHTDVGSAGPHALGGFPLVDIRVVRGHETLGLRRQEYLHAGGKPMDEEVSVGAGHHRELGAVRILRFGVDMHQRAGDRRTRRIEDVAGKEAVAGRCDDSAHEDATRIDRPAREHGKRQRPIDRYAARVVRGWGAVQLRRNVVGEASVIARRKPVDVEMAVGSDDRSPLVRRECGVGRGDPHHRPRGGHEASFVAVGATHVASVDPSLDGAIRTGADERLQDEVDPARRLTRRHIHPLACRPRGRHRRRTVDRSPPW